MCYDTTTRIYSTERPNNQPGIHLLATIVVAGIVVQVSHFHPKRITFLSCIRSYMMESCTGRILTPYKECVCLKRQMITRSAPINFRTQPSLLTNQQVMLELFPVLPLPDALGTDTPLLGYFE